MSLHSLHVLATFDIIASYCTQWLQMISRHRASARFTVDVSPDQAALGGLPMDSRHDGVVVPARSEFPLIPDVINPKTII